MWPISTGTIRLFKKKKFQIKSPSIWSRVPETGSDPPIGSDRDSGRDSNGPLIYQIQREIALISQGTMSVSQYYTKIKKAWDELNCLMPVPNCSCRPCTCGNVKVVASILSNNQLMQFLMGLNESFDGIPSQILLLDSLPSVNKVYSMELRIEKQQEVSDLFTENLENTALFT